MNENRWKCTICGAYKCKTERLAKKFCCGVCQEQAHHKICLLCNTAFSAGNLTQKYCYNCKTDINKINKKRYYNNLKQKQCKICGRNFCNTKRKLLCDSCALIPRKLTYKDRNIVCKMCLKECGQEKVKHIPKTHPVKYIKKCDECHRKESLKNDLGLLSTIINEERKRCYDRIRKLKKYNEMLLEEQVKANRLKLKLEKSKEKQQRYYLEAKKREEKCNKRSKQKIQPLDKDAIFKIKEQNRINLSTRMMGENNPMKRKEVVDKVRTTRKNKIESGELVYVKGNRHHLYKGNRNFDSDCRKWLAKWKKQVLERDNYTCTKCGIRGIEFHIHHITPLRVFIEKVLTSNSISDITTVKQTDISLYETLVSQVVDAHTLSDGITVCKQCHADIDDKYRRIKKRNNHENKENI